MAKPKALSWSSLGRLVLLSSLARGSATTIRDIAEFGYPNFPLLRSSEDMASLIKLRGKGHISKEARRKLEDFLEQQTRKALTRLKLWLGLKRGRPRDFPKRARWNLGAQLREKDRKKNSWRSITRKLDKDGFAKDPRGATDRMRQGILAVEREARTVRQDKGHP